jgi:putative tryptophan/tyrosine transport system substrate-binding protein
MKKLADCAVGVLSGIRKSKSGPADKNSIRQGFFAVVIAFVGLAAVVHAQPPKKIWRLGYLSAVDPATEAARAEGVRVALRERSYIEGQNIAIEYRHAEGNRDRQSELAAELVRLKVDIILVAGGDIPIRAAINATKTIPIVMTGQGSDPVSAGHVESLARPGGNVTGFTILTTELGGKRLELLKEAITKVTRVAVLYDPATPGTAREVKEDLPVAARALKLTVRPWEVRSADNFEKVFAGLTKERPDGLYVTGAGSVMRANRKRIADFALKSLLPSVYSSREGVDAGGLMYYGADLAESYRRVAYYVDRILKGTKPADLPVERPTKFEFVINLKTAKQIGITIPQSVLYRADKVIR